jgi:hypothetical protein
MREYYGLGPSVYFNIATAILAAHRSTVTSYSMERIDADALQAEFQGVMICHAISRSFAVFAVFNVLA